MKKKVIIKEKEDTCRITAVIIVYVDWSWLQTKASCWILNNLLDD